MSNACHEGNVAVMHGVLSGARAAKWPRPPPRQRAPIGGAFDCTRARFRVLQDEGAADLSREAAGPRAMHLLPFVRHASAAGSRFRPEARPGTMRTRARTSKRSKRVVVPGSVAKSPILTHPLAEKAGGDFFHSGGKALGLAKRSRVADTEDLRDWEMTS